MPKILILNLDRGTKTNTQPENKSNLFTRTHLNSSNTLYNTYQNTNASNQIYSSSKINNSKFREQL